MIEKLKTQTIRAYQQLLDMDLGKFSRGVVSVISRETGTIISTSAKGMIVTNLTDNSPSLKQHIAIFCAFPTIAAIVQPYAKYATVFAQIGSDIPLLGSFHDDFFARDIPCISSVSDLHQTFCDRQLDPHQTPALLILYQGAFTWGHTLEDAVNNACYLEEAASLTYLSLQLDPGLVSYK